MLRGWTRLGQATVLVLAACGSSSAPPSGASEGDGGTDANAAEGGLIGGCDPSAEPSGSPRCVTEDLGVFVNLPIARLS
jgi:hypothetical protein